MTPYSCAKRLIFTEVQSVGNKDRDFYLFTVLNVGFFFLYSTPMLNILKNLKLMAL